MPRWLLALAVVLTCGIAHGQVEISEEARREFGVGVNLLEDPNGPRYAEAYDAFHRAYAASPSPKILSNIGLCAMMLERDGEAIDAYQRYLNDVNDVDPRERQKIERDLATLRSGAATLALVIDPANATVIDTRTPASGPPVVNRYPVDGTSLSVTIRAGKHRVEVQAPERQSLEWRFDIAPGKQHDRKVNLQKPGTTVPPPPGPLQAPSPGPTPTPQPEPKDQGGGDNGLLIGGIVSLGVAGACGIAAGVTGGLALKFHAEYYGPGGREAAEQNRATGRGLNIATDVLIPVAGAAAIAGVVLIVVHATRSSSTESALLVDAQGVGLRF